MRKNSLVWALAVIAMLAMLPTSSCIFDAKETSPGDGGGTKPPAFLPLTVRDNLLKNLEQAYEQKNGTEYARLLDLNHFTFFFGQQDIDNGNVNATQWDRATELGATSNLFSDTFVAPRADGPVSRIQLDLTYPAGDDSWLAKPPSDPQKFPNETWYEKTVDYRLTVTAGTFIFTNSNPITANFVLRFTEVNSDSVWQIVEWQDDVR